jgi:hypothetical protein
LTIAKISGILGEAFSIEVTVKNEAELTQSMRLIFAAVASTGWEQNGRLLIDLHMFAQAVQVLKAENMIAERFVIAGEGGSTYCPELSSGIALMILADHISLDTTTFPVTAIIRTKPEEVAQEMRSALYGDAVLFVREYQLRISSAW